ncbi:MAG: STAS/SEC14 domain-containing protein [Haloarculaceae archaeon]
MVEVEWAETSEGAIGWDEEIEAVVHDWSGNPDSQTYRELLRESLSVIERRSATKLLSDSRDMGVLSGADQRWSLEEWYPRAVEAGVERVAVVYPEETLASHQIDAMAREDFDPPVDRLFTDDVDEARDWLALD